MSALTGYDDLNDFIHDDLEDDAASCTSDPDLLARRVQQTHLSESTIAGLNTTDPIKNAFRHIAPMLATRNNHLQTCVHLTLQIIQSDPRRRLLKRASESLVQRLLIFFTQVAEHGKKVHNQNGIGSDGPGTATAILLQEIKTEVKRLQRFVLIHARDSIVISSAKRSRIVFILHELSRVQHNLVSDAQKHLGLGTLGRLQHATLHPYYRREPQLVAVECITNALEAALEAALEEGVPPTSQSIAEYPDLRTDLHLGFFLRNLRYTQGQITVTDHDADRCRDSCPEASACPHHAPFIHEFTPAGLAFKEIGQLHQRREQAYARFTDYSRFWTFIQGEEILSSFIMTADVLLTLSLQLYQLQSKEGPDRFAQVFVATLREMHERFPSTVNRLRLCNALGVLVLIFGESDRDVEAMYAADEALALLQPLYKDDPGQHLPLVASLKLTFSIALSRMADKELGSKTQLLLRSKACRVAAQVTKLAREAHQANPTDTEAKINLALALSSQGGLCRKLSETCAKIEASYRKYLSDKRQFNPHTRSPPPSTQYTRDERDDCWSCGYREDAEAAYEATISILRELAKEAPELCEPLLAETLQAAADVYNSNLELKTELCIARYEEAISIYRRLAESFPLLFNSCLELSNYCLRRALEAAEEKRLRELQTGLLRMGLGLGPDR